MKARHRATHPGWEVIEGRGGGAGRWCKAEAVADGLTRAAGEIIIVADADVWIDKLPAAVELLEGGAPWVVPHGQVHRFNETATAAVLNGEPPAGVARAGAYDDLNRRPYWGRPGGGAVIVRRDDYNRCPLDARFEGWGQEDDSWALALDTLIGPHRRLNAPLWHLWHPPQARLSRRVGSTTGETLWARYERAANRPDLMARLIEEARQCRTSVSS